MSKELEPLLREARIDDARCLQLYVQFGLEGGGARRVEKAGRELARVTSELDVEVARAGEGARRFAGEMRSLAEVARRSSSVPELRKIVAGAVARAEGVVAHVARLESKLVEARRRMAALQGELARARAEALTDSLTGIANRKALDVALQEAADRAMKSRARPQLLLADVDHFKRFNDEYGHLTGDQVLRVVAQILRAAVKKEDVVARAGGEEFAILIQDASLAQAVAIADRLRDAVGRRVIRIRQSGSTLGRITISVGVTPYAPGERVRDWLSRADRALYAAKRQGRNRVVGLPPDPPPSVGVSRELSAAGPDAASTSPPLPAMEDSS